VNVYAASKCQDKVALVITYHTKKAYSVSLLSWPRCNTYSSRVTKTALTL